MQSENLTIEEVANLVLVDEPTVQAWLKRGLEHTEEDGVVRISRADLNAFLEREGQGRARDAASV
jgi:excisionase family DNA binding protein